MVRKILNGKVRVDKLLEEERKALSPQELKLIKMLTKRDRNERFEKPVVG